MISLLKKQPSAWIPLAMSAVALSLVLIHLAIFGIVQETDEGTAAHIFQLLLVGQLPIVGYFAAKWLPKTPRQAFYVLILQACAGLVALAPVFFLEL